MENKTVLVAIRLMDNSTYLTAVDVESSLYTSLLEGLHPEDKMYKFPAGKWVEDLNTSEECIHCRGTFLRGSDILRIHIDPHVGNVDEYGYLQE